MVDEEHQCFLRHLPSGFSDGSLEEQGKNILRYHGFDRPRGMPRKTAWVVDGVCNCNYQYEASKVEPKTFPDLMEELMEVVMPD